MRRSAISTSSFLLIVWAISCRAPLKSIPKVVTIEKLPYSIAVIFSDELETYKERFRGTWFSETRKEENKEPYYFLVGDDLTSSLFMSVRSVYTTVQMED